MQNPIGGWKSLFYVGHWWRQLFGTEIIFNFQLAYFLCFIPINIYFLDGKI